MRSIFFWLLLCFAVAALGGRWTAAAIPTWYAGLHRPSFAPPNWLFGPAWTLLYTLMAVAAWRVALATPSPARTGAIALFLVQLVLNLVWTPIFFRAHALGAALMEILLLWIAIGATTLSFARLSPLAAWLMAPYWAWIGFAAALNAGFWRLNR